MGKFNYGFHEDLDLGSYAALDAINYSTLKHMMRSPLKYRWEKDHPQPPTDAMILGTAAHQLILEPNKVGGFAVWEGGRRYGAAWDKFNDDNDDKTVITVTQLEALVGMATTVRKGVLAKYLAGKGQNEVSMFWRDKASKRDFKGRLDRLVRIGGKLVIVDLKTTRDCHPYRFGADFYRLGYHIQAAMYRDAVFYLTGELPDYVVAAIEQKPPFESAIYTLPDELIQVGKDDMSRLLLQLFECERTNSWPPAIQTETELALPNFAYGEAMDADDIGDLELVME